MPNIKVDQPGYWIAPNGGSDNPNIRTSNRRLGDGDSSPRIVIIEMAPGYVLYRHAHGCERFEMIVKGSIITRDEVLRAGDIMTARAGEYYGPKIAGPEGCTTVEFFEHFDTSGPTYELDDGTLFALPPGSREPIPDNVAERDWINATREWILVDASRATVQDSTGES